MLPGIQSKKGKISHRGYVGPCGRCFCFSLLLPCGLWFSKSIFIASDYKLTRILFGSRRNINSQEHKQLIGVCNAYLTDMQYKPMAGGVACLRSHSLGKAPGPLNSRPLHPALDYSGRVKPCVLLCFGHNVWDPTLWILPERNGRPERWSRTTGWFSRLGTWTWGGTLGTQAWVVL